MSLGVQLLGERAEVRREWLVTGAVEELRGGRRGALAAPARPGGSCGIPRAQSGGSSMQAPPSRGSQIAMARCPHSSPAPGKPLLGSVCLLRSELARPTTAGQATWDPQGLKRHSKGWIFLCRNSQDAWFLHDYGDWECKTPRTDSFVNWIFRQVMASQTLSDITPACVLKKLEQRMSDAWPLGCNSAFCYLFSTSGLILCFPGLFSGNWESLT